MEGHVYAGLVVNGPKQGEFLQYDQPVYKMHDAPPLKLTAAPVAPIDLTFKVLVYEHIEDRTGAGRHSWRLRP